MKEWFSVIVPVYNVDKYIDRCVASLINQSFKQIEIILVDDGSTDASGKKCDEYQKKYENIKVIHKKNGGLASARNEGLKYAKGKYVAFVDADDWIQENTYQLLFEKIQNETQNIDIVNFGYQKIKNSKIAIKEYSEFVEGLYSQEKIKKLILPDSIARKKAFNQVNLPVQLSACMCIYNRKFLCNYKLCFESERIVLCEDWLFNIKCLCRANSILILHDILYNYDTRNDSLSMSYKEDSYERKKNLYSRYKEELSVTGNRNSEIDIRLRNFWLEAIYGCYIIELNAPVWNKKRVNSLCNDLEFKSYLKTLTYNNCSLKGLIFKFIIETKMHWIMKLAYTLKR